MAMTTFVGTLAVPVQDRHAARQGTARASSIVERARTTRDAGEAVRSASPSRRLRSRWPLHFAHVWGEVAHEHASAVVRKDGSAVAPPTWMRSAGLPLDCRPPVGGIDPLQVTILLTRACDRLLRIDLLDAGLQRRPGTAGIRAFASDADPGFWMDEEHVGDVHHVRLRGELDVVSAPTVEERLVRIAGSTVEVDLSLLSFIDARGVTALVSARRRVLEGGDRFHLTGANGLVRRVFSLLDLEGILGD